MKLLVPSCNAYRATWEPFTAFLRHSWPDCPYELTIASEGDSGDQGWCANLVRFVDAVEDTHVLMMLDDHWIDGSVDTEEILSLESRARSDPRIGCVRLSACPGRPPHHELLWDIMPRVGAYYCSTAPSIWDCWYLRTIAESMVNMDMETAQMFERIGSVPARFITDKHVLAPRQGHTPLPFINPAIRDGKWMRHAVEKAAELGITIDTSERGFYE